MAQRITKKELEGVVDQINRMTNSPLEPYSKDAEGKLIVNVGCYTLSYAYGGVELQRMHNRFGGSTTPLNSGHVSKRELYNLMQAFIKGLRASNS